jgi:signal transduction histidine kinase
LAERAEFGEFRFSVAITPLRSQRRLALPVVLFMLAASAAFLATPFASSAASPVEPKRVMLLHSFGPQFGPWSAYAKAIRDELRRQMPGRLDISDHSLVSARDRDETAEIAFVEYLRALYTRRPLDLIITLGAPAVDFVQRRRQQLFPVTPFVFTALEQRRIGYSNLTENDVVVTYTHDFPAFFESILRVLPDTKTLAVVNGKSAVEQFWDGEIRRDAKAFEHRMTFRWYNELSLEDILKDVAALPPRSAIFFELMSIDAAGVVHEGDTALKQLHAVANAPIFSYQDAFFGPEIVGGPMHSVPYTSERAVAAAIRILQGEKPSDIKFPVGAFSVAKYNWQEMQRWGISESRLPSGAEVYFREITLWERYRWHVVAVIAALLLQAALISWQLYEHRRRQIAEVQSRNAMAELAHLNRLETAGQLSASIAHEINQPITGMVLKARAALRWLAVEKTDVDKIRNILTEIVNAGLHAGDIITGVRAMFKKDMNANAAINLNNLINTVLALLRLDLQEEGVRVEAQLEEELPAVTGDAVQLQQVILNLIVNAADAMRTVEPRVLQVRSNRTPSGMVCVSIEDSGTGIGALDMHRIFDPLFTTKAGGMGMGLSICRSIIESHGGRLWGSAAASRGAVFQFELPAAAGVKPDQKMAA